MASENNYAGITWIDHRTAKFDDIEDVTVVFSEQENPDVVKTVLGMLIMSRINQ